ncbi:hypothetical protein [Bacillus sp. FSL K6-6540]|uniref:hypothetical protein n=1 Tax=Bacillus sp. FSL K6-6540 TaxID=2921512 RepID=UPI0030FCD2AA
MSNEKKHKKLDKHFDVTINYKKTKILNYLIEHRTDNHTGEEVKVLTIITKIYNEVFKENEILIHISKDGTDVELKGKYKSALLQPGLRRYIYIIE